MQRCDSCFTPLDGGGRCAKCSQLNRSPLALPLGTMLRENRYRVGRTLGDPGGFGVTYLGWDSSLERLVAIKEFFPGHIATRSPVTGQPIPTSDEGAEDFRLGLRGFLEEARLLAKLDHPNIVKVHDYCEAGGTGYLVMAYYEGHDLKAHAEEAGGKLGWQDALGFMLPLLEGLEEVHRAGLIHRDVKPANIYLAVLADKKRRPILIDFGAARWASTSRELTAILTEGFAPLEQYPNCGPQGPYTDIYAAAATIYVLISGIVPASATARLSGGYVAHLTDQVPGVPRRLGDAIELALSVQPSERPQSAGEFARVLRASMPKAPTGGVSHPVSAPVSSDSTVIYVPPTQPSGGAGVGGLLSGGSEPVPRTQPRAAEPIAPVGGRRIAWIAVGVGIVGVAVVAAMKLFPNSRGSEAPAQGAAQGPPGSSAAPNTPPVGAGGAQATELLAAYEALRNDGNYAGAMTSLNSAHNSLATLSPSVQAARAKLLDSLSKDIITACALENSMLKKRGEKPAACPAQGW